MSDTAIQVEDLSKQYRLGVIGTGTLSHDLNRWWHLARGKEDPYLKVGEANDRSTRAGSDLVWALRDINFEVKRGEVLGIIGKNGAGKSTLLKILSKVTSPTTGRIKVWGRIASLLEVGTGFHPELTGRENIFLNGAILGMTKKQIRYKLEEIIDFSGVEGYIDTPVKRYSSGMYVRLAFAVAAHLESEILIVDEVLAVGDAEFQKKCLGKMGEVSKGEGRTVLFVSHNLNSVLKLCNDSVLLVNGELAAKGETSNIISKYLNNGEGNRAVFQRGSENDTYKKVTITQANLLNDKNELTTEFEWMDEIKIEIVVHISFPGDRYSFSIELNSLKHESLFISCYYDDNIDRLVKNYWSAGIYNFFVKIPGKLLRSGEYRINIASAIPNIEILDFVENALEFKVIEKNSPVAMSNEQRDGKILPILEWAKVNR